MVDLDPLELGTESDGSEAATCELPKYVSCMSWRIFLTHTIFTSRLDAFRITCSQLNNVINCPLLKNGRIFG
jgi:hypothetical protein